MNVDMRTLNEIIESERLNGFNIVVDDKMTGCDAGEVIINEDGTHQINIYRNFKAVEAEDGFFIATLYHEIGHVIDYKKRIGKYEGGHDAFLTDYDNRVEAEYQAHFYMLSRTYDEKGINECSLIEAMDLINMEACNAGQGFHFGACRKIKESKIWEKCYSYVREKGFML